jgi:hypothetical protein
MKINGIDVLTNFERKGFNAESESLGLKAVGILQGLGASPGEKRVGGHPLEAGGGEQAILSGLLRLDLRAFAVVQRHAHFLWQGIVPKPYCAATYFPGRGIETWS